MKMHVKAMLVALVALLAGALTAPAAQAYPNPTPGTPTITFSLGGDVLVGGNSLHVTVKANITCDWTLTYLGKSHTGRGKTFTTTFPTPQVSTRTNTTLFATCGYDTTVFTRGNAVVFAKPATATASARVVLVPVNSGGPSSTGGSLPNTGGPNLWLLLGALALLVGGGSLIVSKRRRDEDSTQTPVV